jgi:hypothetical protein
MVPGQYPVIGQDAWKAQDRKPDAWLSPIVAVILEALMKWDPNHLPISGYCDPIQIFGTFDAVDKQYSIKMIDFVMNDNSV